METESITLEKAIALINEGKIVTHEFLKEKSLRRTSEYEASHGIVHGWDDKTDPLHNGTTYYKEYISPVIIYDKREALGVGSIHFNWVDNPDKRMIPVDGWVLK